MKAILIKLTYSDYDFDTYAKNLLRVDKCTEWEEVPELTEEEIKYIELYYTNKHRYTSYVEYKLIIKESNIKPLVEEALSEKIRQALDSKVKQEEKAKKEKLLAEKKELKRLKAKEEKEKEKYLKLKEKFEK